MVLPANIEIKPDVMLGKPCIKGTRIPVYIMLKKLGAGETVDEILESYPQLTKEHLNAALEYKDLLKSHYQ
jgi:uncharacterized protein (DUF433 family)